MTPGKNPASAAPRRNRIRYSDVGPVTSAIAPAKMPHVSMIRAIQRRAPTRASSRLLGTSHRKYDRKKMPPPNPKTVGDRRRSLTMSSAANPRLTRSTKETK
jgi:hypothetical protein